VFPVIPVIAGIFADFALEALFGRKNSKPDQGVAA
jgi:hypothetical protein